MENTLEKVICVLSGGIDSTTLLYKLSKDNYNIYAISFNYGQKHRRELDCAKYLCNKLGVPHKIIDLQFLKDLAPSSLTSDDLQIPEGHYTEDSMKKTVVPNRNMVMLSLSTSYAISIGAKRIFYGAHRGDHAIYPDCRPEFVNAMNEAIKISDWSEAELEAPFLEMDKGDILSLGNELSVDYANTWTCYKGQEKACGRCGSCVERLEAFQKAGIKDPIVYEDI